MHPIENIMQTAMNEIKEMVDVNTIVGDAVVTPDGSTVIPISKVSFGFVAGGGEYMENMVKEGQSTPFAGGSGAGVSISPVGFLILKDDVRLYTLNHKNTYEKIIEVIPQLITEVTSAIRNNQESE